MGISPRKYIEESRIGLLKLRLAKGENVIDAIRGSGYSAQSWLYEDSKSKLGMTPGTYRKGGQGMRVGYAVGNSPIGRLLVASTEHGICSVMVGESDEKLVSSLRREYPKSDVQRDQRVNALLKGVQDRLRGQENNLPLDLRGTDFQLKVWGALLTIPLGETRSYTEVADMVGRPSAVRAVANACATNPVPLIVPCHRVIRKDGSLGGYGLGLPRKKMLLFEEKRLAGKK